MTTETSRGAKAKTDAAGVVRAVSRMTKEEGEKAGVENHRLYFRTYNDKANLRRPPTGRTGSGWKASNLGNGAGNRASATDWLTAAAGDSVGVVSDGNGRTHGRCDWGRLRQGRRRNQDREVAQEPSGRGLGWQGGGEGAETEPERPGRQGQGRRDDQVWVGRGPLVEVRGRKPSARSKPSSRWPRR